MIITIAIIGFTLFSILYCYMHENVIWKYQRWNINGYLPSPWYLRIWDFDWLHGISIGGVIFGTVLSVVCLLIIGVEHCGISQRITESQIQYESIQRQYDKLQSNYEDMADVTVYQRIGDWNQSVSNYKYWTENPVTSWFHSQELADSLEYIDY